MLCLTATQKVAVTEAEDFEESLSWVSLGTDKSALTPRSHAIFHGVRSQLSS